MKLDSAHHGKGGSRADHFNMARHLLFKPHHHLSHQQHRRSKCCWFLINPKTVLLLLLIVLIALVSINTLLDASTATSDTLLLQQGGRQTVKPKSHHLDQTATPPPPLVDPATLVITQEAKLAWDPYSVLEEEQEAQNNDSQKDKQKSGFWKGKSEKTEQAQLLVKAQELLQLFELEYGTHYGRSMLSRAVHTVHRQPKEEGSKPDHLASNNNIQSLARALHHRDKRQPLHIVVLGNGAAAGYGNFRHHTYSVQLQMLLNQLSQDTTVKVTNLAMDQSTEFPTVWCLESHLLAEPVHAFVYDFVGSTPPRLEAVLRNLLSTFGTNLIFIARYASRHLQASAFLQVLERYCPMQNGKNKSLSFAACLWLELEGAVEPLVRALEARNDELPPGFDGWTRKFGSGRKPSKLYHDLDHLDHQRPHYLTAPQHRWIAWCLAMPFLSAALSQEQLSSSSLTQPATSLVLPPPLLLDPSLDALLLGGSTNKNTTSSTLQCYTSFEYVARNADMTDVVEDGNDSSHAAKDSRRPSRGNSAVSAVDHLHIPGNLQSVVSTRRTGNRVVGSTKELLKPKMTAVQDAAWVYDLDASAKRQKRTMQHASHPHEPAFYGMPDWKIAYYGAFQSGVLKLELPIDPVSDAATLGSGGGGTALLRRQFQRRRRPLPAASFSNATYHVESLIFCQADVPMDSAVTGCLWHTDVEIKVGGVTVNKTRPLDATYDIVVSTRGGTHAHDVQPLCRRASVPPKAQITAAVLDVELTVTNPRVLWHAKAQKSIPCSLSHVLVEHKGAPAVSKASSYKSRERIGPKRTTHR